MMGAQKTPYIYCQLQLLCPISKSTVAHQSSYDTFKLKSALCLKKKDHNFWGLKDTHTTLRTTWKIIYLRTTSIQNILHLNQPTRTILKKREEKKYCK